MSKRNLVWDENKLHKKKGRGCGEGKDYLPWLIIQDMPSMGRVSRIYSPKTQRIHHLFSDIETRMFYLISWENKVIDIREQYPLFNMEEVIKDTKGIDFNKFFDRETGTPYVFTTTFLITYKNTDNRESYIARSVKSADKLENHIIEKFEVEKRYWESKGVDWGIVTQKDINVIKAKNIEWVYSTLADDEMGINQKNELSQMLLKDLVDSNNKVRTITLSFDKKNNLEPGTGIYLFKYLIAIKNISVDMNIKIDINAPGNVVILNVKGKE